MILILMVIAFLVSALLTLYFSRPGTVFCVLDKPNARSLHTRPIPISGGLAMLMTLTILASLGWYSIPMGY